MKIILIKSAILIKATKGLRELKCQRIRGRKAMQNRDLRHTHVNRHIYTREQR